MTIHTFNSTIILFDSKKSEGEFVCPKLAFSHGDSEELMVRGTQYDSDSLGEAIYKSFNFLSGPYFSAMSNKFNPTTEQEALYLERFGEFLKKMRPNIDAVNDEFAKIFAPQE